MDSYGGSHYLECGWGGKLASVLGFSKNPPPQNPKASDSNRHGRKLNLTPVDAFLLSSTVTTRDFQNLETAPARNRLQSGAGSLTSKMPRVWGFAPFWLFATRPFNSTTPYQNQKPPELPTDHRYPVRIL